MGGYGSGRRKAHSITGECLPIDTTFLLKRKMLTGKRLEQGGKMLFTSSTKDMQGKVTEAHHNLYCIVKRYGDEGGQFSTWDVAGHITLIYAGKQGEQKKSFSQDIPLVVTHPNYGGVRWWYLAPCCGRRVRVLYLPVYGNLEQCKPQCRECLDLNYASQRQDYIERHKTYERYLLANYGLYWASHRYDFELKEHYLKMTPELWALRMKSVIDWNLHLLKTVIRCDLAIYRSDLANLKSLRSEEDRRVYLAHMEEKERRLNTSNLVRVLQQCIAYERLVYEVNTRAMPEHLFELYQQITDLGRDIDSQVQPNAPEPVQVETIEQKIISLEGLLKRVNKAEKKAA